MRSTTPGYEQIFQHDKRRGVWMRVVRDAASMVPLRLDLCSGREGDDQDVTFLVGEVVSAKMLEELANVVAYAKHAKAAFDPPFCICFECGTVVQ